jgi:DNA-binding transcriptional regulator YdaS (Cro superfamily)
MDDDKADSSMNSIPSVSLFRGIYNRVAKRLGVDPSYVSRVARGERKSETVEKALADEVRAIREHLNNHELSNSNNHNHNNQNHNNQNRSNSNHNHNNGNHNHNNGNHNHNQPAPLQAQKKKAKSRLSI